MENGLYAKRPVLSRCKRGVTLGAFREGIVYKIALICFGLLGTGSWVSTCFGQAVEVREEQVTPGVGREKAAGYFRDRRSDRTPGPREPVGTGGAAGARPRYLAIHAGSFFADQGYKWGKGGQGNIGKLNVGLDYRLGEWVNAADVSLRVDYTTFELSEGLPRKLSAHALLTFPDANSRFPLYFGVSVGPGFFIKQIRNESVLALDYGLLAGARLLDVIEKVGFMAEIGLKDHLFLLSDGQFNGFYFNLGCVFAF